MMVLLLITLGLMAVFSTPTTALAFEGLKPTAAYQNELDVLGWTPQPTGEATLELFKRQSLSSTCGFVTGDPLNPFTCINGGYDCAYDNENLFFGCCQSDLINGPSCQVSFGCYDATAAFECVGACTASNFVCVGNKPWCTKDILLVGPISTYTSYGCGLLPAINTLFQEAITSTTPIIITTASSTAASSTAASSTAASSAASDTSPSRSASTKVSPSPAASTPTPHHSHAGAIAGGVIAGMIVIGVAVAGLILYLRKRKQRQRMSIVPEVSQM